MMMSRIRLLLKMLHWSIQIQAVGNVVSHRFSDQTAILQLQLSKLPPIFRYLPIIWLTTWYLLILNLVLCSKYTTTQTPINVQVFHSCSHSPQSQPYCTPRSRVVMMASVSKFSYSGKGEMIGER
jgi:hypothetical protein